MNGDLNANNASGQEEVTRRRLRYRSWHRGCKETDLLLGHFADRFLETLPAPELAVYDALLDEDDAHIWDWLVGNSSPADERYLPLLEKLRHIVP